MNMLPTRTLPTFIPSALSRYPVHNKRYGQPSSLQCLALCYVLYILTCNLCWRPRLCLYLLDLLYSKGHVKVSTIHDSHLRKCGSGIQIVDLPDLLSVPISMEITVVSSHFAFLADVKFQIKLVLDFDELCRILENTRFLYNIYSFSYIKCSYSIKFSRVTCVKCQIDVFL